MILFHIEYVVVSTGMTFICDVVGTSENDVVQDIVSQVGNIQTTSIFRKSGVHRITGTIRKNILERSVSKEPRKGKGRPRKYDL